MPTLPPITDWTGPSVTEGQFKTAQGQLRDFLAGLLGADGTAATALATLGAAFAGVATHTAAYTVTTGDRGKLLLCSGTWTLTLPTATTAGAGFMFAARNTGTGTITVDGNGAEQIDGADTLALGSGEPAILVCNGSEWYTVGGSKDAKTLEGFPASYFYSPGNPPPNPTTAQVLNATAGLTAGAVGSYAFVTKGTSGYIGWGATVAGSSLTPSESSDQFRGGASLTGTWRILGSRVDGDPTGSGSGYLSALAVRIA